MAFAQPYTFTNLQNYLRVAELTKSQYLKREILCYSLIGTPCDLLTITGVGLGKKKGVVLTGRVHPGESVSSWMMQGVIDFLLSEDKMAEYLRRKFIFKIVPMVNPDGVIQGNYRTSLAGYDLNRRYTSPSKILHPTIFHTKKMAKQFAKSCPLILYCDFHGHSKSKNVFMYGNTSEDSPEQYRIFPYIMSKMCTHFSFKDSKFVVQKSKTSTARVVMWKELGISSVFTIEASFFGPGNREDNPQFSIQDLMDIGKSMCQALAVYNKIIEAKDSLLADNNKIYKVRRINSIQSRDIAINIMKEIKENKNFLCSCISSAYSFK